ncbi:MAG: class IV adenylate cyclase [Candidatus Andersenbacteria bacterium]
MKEIEVVYKVLSPKAAVLKKLRRFKHVGIKHTVDVYYYDPLRPDLKPDREHRLHSAFRLRVKAGQPYLTYKKDHFAKSGAWAYTDEHETAIADAATAARIIEHLGLKPLVKLDMRKHTYVHGPYEIVFEEVKKLGTFLEVELRRPSHASVKTEMNKIRSFVATLGLKLEEKHMGKPEMMVQKQTTRKYS